tara:strand:+ start:3741 stop:4922 length:1182 start_codon:yes stop_codon:yes gene_type:complete
MKKIDFVVLAGGKGSRIKNYLDGKPKPMLKFNNKYFLDYLINNLCKYPANKIYILTGYRSKTIYEHFHKKKINFTEIHCLKEKKPMGTAGALNILKKHKLNDFILINGDTIFDINFHELVKSLKKNCIGSMSLTNFKNNTLSNKLNKLSLKKGIVKSGKKFINGGVYFFKKKILNAIQRKQHSLENDILPELITGRKISGKIFKNFFLDIGTPKYLKKSEKKLLRYFNKPAVFLDRDGVINYDNGYVHQFKKFKLRKNVIPGLHYLIKKNYYIFIITNQAGIGKGVFSLKDFHTLHIKLKYFFSEKKIFINDVKFSPYHPDAKIKKYRKKTNYRKPGNLMIQDVFKNWDILKNKSFMIGDKKSDFLAAKKSNLRFEYAKPDFLKQIKDIINNY